MTPKTLANVETSLKAMREGRMVILVDDEDRENEGDLCMAAELVTPEAINFMANGDAASFASRSRKNRSIVSSSL